MVAGKLGCLVLMQMLEKGRGVLCKSPLVKYKFIQAHNKHFKVVTMCQVLNVHRSGYYAWSSNPDSSRALDNRVLLVEIKQFFTASGSIYGSPRIYQDCKSAGLTCSENRVAREALKAEIFDYIDVFCNRIRRHNYLSPVQFEQ